MSATYEVWPTPGDTYSSVKTLCSWILIYKVIEYIQFFLWHLFYYIKLYFTIFKPFVSLSVNTLFLVSPWKQDRMDMYYLEKCFCYRIDIWQLHITLNYSSYFMKLQLCYAHGSCYAVLQKCTFRPENWLISWVWSVFLKERHGGKKTL